MGVFFDFLEVPRGGGAGYPRFMHYKIRVSHVPPASRRGMVQHYTISWYQHYWLVVWNHGILWLSIGKSINIISWCSRWFSRTKPSARLRGYSPLLAVVEVCIQRRGRSKSWHAWGAAGGGGGVRVWKHGADPAGCENENPWTLGKNI